MAKVAILGVGKMGAAMAKELAAANHEVLLWNRTSEKSIEIANSISNARVVGSVADALSEADFAICTFVNGEVTEKALLDNPVNLKNANKSIVIADMGTSGLATANTLNQSISQAGLKFIDSPVSGSIATIAAHQLLVMASGDTDSIAKIEPIFLTFSKKVLHVGEVGAGQAVKLAVNLIVHSLNASLSEALALATTAGVSPGKVYEVFDESVIAAPFVKYKKAAFLDPSTPVAMRIDTVVKDLNLILALASELGIELNATQAVVGLYRNAVAQGAGDQDMAALARHLKL